MTTDQADTLRELAQADRERDFHDLARALGVGAGEAEQFWRTSRARAAGAPLTEEWQGWA